MRVNHRFSWGATALLDCGVYNSSRNTLGITGAHVSWLSISLSMVPYGAKPLVHITYCEGDARPRTGDRVGVKRRVLLSSGHVYWMSRVSTYWWHTNIEINPRTTHIDKVHQETIYCVKCRGQHTLSDAIGQCKPSTYVVYRRPHKPNIYIERSIYWHPRGPNIYWPVSMFSPMGPQYLLIGQYVTAPTAPIYIDGTIYVLSHGTNIYWAGNTCAVPWHQDILGGAICMPSHDTDIYILGRQYLCRPRISTSKIYITPAICRQFAIIIYGKHVVLSEVCNITVWQI